MIAGQILSAFLRAVGQAAVANGISAGAVLTFTNLGAALIDRDTDASEEMQTLTLDIERMVVQNREPTQEEWDEWSTRSSTASNIIQAWRPSPA